MLPAVVHPSLQRRTIRTAELAVADRDGIPVRRSWRTARLLPYWYDAIVPDLRFSGCVLVVSHGNTVWAMVKYLDALTGDEVATLNIPTAIPRVYQLGSDMRPDALGGVYLDPHVTRDALADLTPA